MKKCLMNTSIGKTVLKRNFSIMDCMVFDYKYFIL